MTVTINGDCGLCVPVGTGRCEAVGGGHYCTRERGHDGEHVACGGDVHAMYRWGPDG